MNVTTSLGGSRRKGSQHVDKEVGHSPRLGGLSPKLCRTGRRQTRKWIPRRFERNRGASQNRRRGEPSGNGTRKTSLLDGVSFGFRPLLSDLFLALSQNLPSSTSVRFPRIGSFPGSCSPIPPFSPDSETGLIHPGFNILP